MENPTLKRIKEIFDMLNNVIDNRRSGAFAADHHSSKNKGFGADN